MNERDEELKKIAQVAKELAPKYNNATDLALAVQKAIEGKANAFGAPTNYKLAAGRYYRF